MGDVVIRGPLEVVTGEGRVDREIRYEFIVHIGHLSVAEIVWV
jgi:hypothetical protein